MRYRSEISRGLGKPGSPWGTASAAGSVGPWAEILAAQSHPVGACFLCRPQQHTAAAGMAAVEPQCPMEELPTGRAGPKLVERPDRC